MHFDMTSLAGGGPVKPNHRFYTDVRRNARG